MQVRCQVVVPAGGLAIRGRNRAGLLRHCGNKNSMSGRKLIVVLLACLLTACTVRAQKASDFDLIVRRGVVYDGSGHTPIVADVGVRGQRIVAVGDLSRTHAAHEVNAHGLAVAPGFVNMLSWAPDTLYLDGRSLSDIKQGVTLEVFGEGESLGPLTAQTRAAALASQGDLKHPIDWTTLGEGLDALVKRGISPNIASFVGAATIREHELGYANRAPTPDELKCMQDLVRVAMREGAVGVGSALIYAPGTYAKTDELVALAQVAGKYHGAYISHMRSEGDRLLESVDELIEIARAAQVHGEVYHFKAAGKANWPKMREAIAKIDAARARGLDISANMYTYTAGATGLDAAMPTWVQEGGIDEWIKRLKNPAIRARVVREMRTPSGDWENLLLAAGSADKVVLVQFDNPVLKPLTGKTLAEVARRRGESPEETAIDLVIQDHSRVGTVYFLMSEDDVELGLKQSWVAIGSDEGSYAPEGVFLKFMPHPRAYGNVARFLGHYVRDEHVTSLTDAIHRLSALPAHNLKLHDRGELKPGDYADIVIFDPIKIADQATYDHPQQFATGVRDVFVNGVQVLKNGEHTGAMPGQVVRGPGWSGWPDAVKSPHANDEPQPAP